MSKKIKTVAENADGSDSDQSYLFASYHGRAGTRITLLGQIPKEASRQDIESFAASHLAKFWAREGNADRYPSAEILRVESLGGSPAPNGFQYAGVASAADPRLAALIAEERATLEALELGMEMADRRAPKAKKRRL